MSCGRAIKSKNGWTEERRAKQRAAILRRAPWKKSTGPRTEAGKKKSAQNAYKHGHRGREWREFYALLAKKRLYVRRVLAERMAQAALAAQKNMTNELMDFRPLWRGGEAARGAQSAVAARSAYFSNASGTQRGIINPDIVHSAIKEIPEPVQFGQLTPKRDWLAGVVQRCRDGPVECAVHLHPVFIQLQTVGIRRSSAVIYKRNVRPCPGGKI